MRLVQVALIITTMSLAWSPASAEQQASVSEIETKIKRVQVQYDAFNEQVQSATEAQQRLRAELDELRAQSSSLERERRQALDRMNRMYRELVDNPDTDISAAQQDYQQAVRAHQRNLEQVAAKSTALAEQQSETERMRMNQHSLVNQLEVLREQHQFARVARLREEFNRRGEVEASQSLVCERDETLNQCETRAELMAKQRASRNYLDSLFRELSEAELVSSRKGNSAADVRVLGSNVVSNQYSGQRNYDVRLRVQMEGRLPENHACELLQLDQRYCSNNVNAERSPGERDGVKKPEAESVMHRLVVRSNVHNDQVYVNGERYGSTPVEIMLPPGEHKVEISRHGYERFETVLNVRESQSIRGELKRARFAFAPGERTQDIISDEVDGPALIVVPPGRGRMGDHNGRGRENERPVRGVEFAAPFALAVTPITVRDFTTFVNATSHVTDAEKGRGCAVLENGLPEANPQYSWQRPGYEISDNLPVTCVSFRDAQRYAQWLSEITGQKYSVPTEDEWEYSARAGSTADYWWGDSIGVGRANCRACGNDWSGAQPSPVASYESNPWGLFDVVGNVWEWARPHNGARAVARGGAFNFAPTLARSSTRMEMTENFSANYIGFRVARTE